MDLTLTLAGFFVGIVVGLTGMGGGALMTPILTLFFGIPPLAAVSSDLVVSAVMKPVGSVVHLRRGTVNLSLVKWLCAGSVPCAFFGVLLVRALGDGAEVQHAVKVALGVALLLTAGALVVKAYLSMVERAQRRAAKAAGLLSAEPQGPPRVRVRPLPTLLIGAVGGLVVGMTSVGSGSLIIVALIMLYPSLKASELVGTDLLQAVPLVISAALGHYFFGSIQLDVTTALLIGSIPGVYLGARVSAFAPGSLIRRALALVLLASGLKLLDASNTVLVGALVAVAVLGPVVWMAARRHNGLPMVTPRHKQRASGDGSKVGATASPTGASVSTKSGAR